MLLIALVRDPPVVVYNKYTNVIHSTFIYMRKKGFYIYGFSSVNLYFYVIPTKKFKILIISLETWKNLLVFYKTLLIMNTYVREFMARV